ncbi:MAG TPA: group 1 truncated hemoglobin [Urbifossiella sp.]|jgi:hemoglobin|nr:group 1 truncated hemoglobin [Urbifossiella sp.]
MRARATVAVWLFTVSAGLALAQPGPGPLDRVEQDKRTAVVAYQSVLIGSDLYNRKNFEGCYRLYQGTLLAVQPMIDHRPDLSAFVKHQLDKAALMQPADGAFELRKALDAVQAETAETLKKPLWERLGGEKTVRVVVKDFLAAAVADPKVNFTRDGKYKLDEKGMAKLEQSIVELLSQVTGGPLKYSGKDLQTIHTGMKVTEAEFNAMIIKLAVTAEKHGLKQGEMVDLVKVVAASRPFIVGK